MTHTTARRRLLGLNAILAIALLAVTAHKAAALLLPTTDIAVMPEPDCDLQRSNCGASLPEGRIDLEFLAHPIPLAKSFQVSLATQGIDADRVEIDFAGADMDMGPNRSELISIGNGLYAGEASLPVCLTGPMKWHATVIVHAGRRRLVVPYEFHTGAAR